MNWLRLMPSAEAVSTARVEIGIDACIEGQRASHIHPLIRQQPKPPSLINCLRLVGDFGLAIDAPHKGPYREMGQLHQFNQTPSKRCPPSGEKLNPCTRFDTGIDTMTWAIGV